MERGDDFEAQLKLLLIGDSGVGKTCVLLRFVDRTFSDTFITTIGIDFKAKVVNVGGRKVKMQIWDTAGQERFRTITTSYFRGAQGVALVFDLTDRTTFENVASWMDQIKTHAGTNLGMVLIANKADMEAAYQVSVAEGERLAAKYKIPYFVCSAKTGVNVDKAMTELARVSLERDDAAAAGGGGGVDITKKPKAKESGGCGCVLM